MSRIDAVCREGIEQSEWVAIATAGRDGPHLAAGPKAEAVKARFSWARGVLPVKVNRANTHLP